MNATQVKTSEWRFFLGKTLRKGTIIITTCPSLESFKLYLYRLKVTRPERKCYRRCDWATKRQNKLIMKLFKILALLILFYGCGYKKNKTDEEKLVCLQDYITNISKLPLYSELRKGIIDSLKYWKSKTLELKCCNLESGVLDSAIFFSIDFSRCLFLFIDSLSPDSNNKWNDVKTLGGEKIGNSWHYYHVSFPVLAYSLKANKYKNLSFNYLSRDARLDIINRGFFKPGACEIDSSFLYSEEWFADWVRKKHKLFLKGK